MQAKADGEEEEKKTGEKEQSGWSKGCEGCDEVEDDDKGADEPIPLARAGPDSHR